MALLAIPAGSAQALPIVVSDFAVDPSGSDFTVQIIGRNQYLTNNLSNKVAPYLGFGVTDPVTGTPNTLLMNWTPKQSPVRSVSWPNRRNFAGRWVPTVAAWWKRTIRGKW